MALSKETKESIIHTYKTSERDTGSSAAQVALLTHDIEKLTEEHFRVHPKDKHSLRGLRRMVDLRKKHLKYLKRKQPKVHKKIVEELGLRH